MRTIANMDISRFPGLREHHACWYCCLHCHPQNLVVFECRKQGPTVRIGFEKNDSSIFLWINILSSMQGMATSIRLAIKT